jgi:hypothetical protein
VLAEGLLLQRVAVPVVGLERLDLLRHLVRQLRTFRFRRRACSARNIRPRAIPSVCLQQPHYRTQSSPPALGSRVRQIAQIV